jgi:tRNA-intron endonuclease
LDIVEGVYLLEKGIITVEFDSKVLGIRKLKALARKQFQGFDIKYIIYKDLREKGFIVTPGVKYGCDFAVYEHGPGIDHAPYIIQVKTNEDEITAAEIVESGRLASTVKKSFIIAVIDNKNPQYLEFKWWKA